MAASVVLMVLVVLVLVVLVLAVVVAHRPWAVAVVVV
jgi:hypothetical protein